MLLVVSIIKFSPLVLEQLKWIVALSVRVMLTLIWIIFNIFYYVASLYNGHGASYMGSVIIVSSAVN